MNTLTAFYDYVTSQGIDIKAIYEEKGEGFVVISFPERGDNDCIYNIAIVFYENDNDVEIYVRKPIKDFDELTLLRKLNNLNCEYTDVTFFIDENILTLKSHLLSQGKVENVLIKMVTDVQLAQAEFVKI
ncbi:MAG: hypothetical protein Q4D76_17480 [Oscillospiraceae bacterium]|nr:hypothetical protein [Oscillospiraceae bacterium]